MLFGIGVFCVLAVFVWYKQFSYFHYDRTTYGFDDEGICIGEEENAEYEEFGFSGAGLHRCAIRKFSDISPWYELRMDNTTTEALWIFLYEDGKEGLRTEADAIQLLPSEELVRRNNSRSYRDLVLEIYSEGTPELDALSPSVGNLEVMAELKKAVLILLILMAVWTCLCTGFSLFEKLSGSFGMWCNYGLSIFLLAYTVLGVFVSRLAVLYDLLLIPAACSALMGFLFSLKKERTACELTETPEKEMYFSGAVAAVSALFLFFLMLTSREGSLLWHFNSENHTNVLDYILVLAFFGLLLLAGNILWPKLKPYSRIRAYIDPRKGLTGLILFMLCLFYGMINYGTDIPDLLGLPIFILIFFGLILYLKYVKVKEGKKASAALLFIYAPVVLFTTLNCTFIDIWDGSAANIYHSSWLFYSLYEVAYGKPFYGGCMEIYGHYALIYRIPLAIFGNTMETIGGFTGLVGLGMICAMLAALHRRLKTNSFRLIGALMLFAAVTLPYHYPMIFPHRMLFPFLLIWLCVKKKDRLDKASVCAVGYLICVVSILWNTESGLVCAVAWAVTRTVVRFQKKKGIPALFTAGISELLIVAAEVFAAYLIVKVYNYTALCANGAGDVSFWAEFADWKKEMGVLVLTDFMKREQAVLIRWGNAPWIYILLFFLMLGAYLFVHIGIYRKMEKKEWLYPDLMALVICIGFFTDWIARPEQYDIIKAPLAYLLVVYAEALYLRYRERKQRGQESMVNAALVFCMIFSVTAHLCVMPATVKNTWKHLVTQHQLDGWRVEEYLADFEKAVPKGTYGEGYGIRLIYLLLDWRDMKNPGTGSGGSLELGEQPYDELEYYLNTDKNADIPGYVLEKEIPFGKYCYYLWKNTNK